MLKQCTKCHQEKEETKFKIHHYRKDGSPHRNTVCSYCKPNANSLSRKEANRKYNQSQKGKEAKARARQTDSYKEAQKKYIAKPEVREKLRASAKVRKQTEAGKLSQINSVKKRGTSAENNFLNRVYKRTYLAKKKYGDDLYQQQPFKKEDFYTIMEKQRHKCALCKCNIKTKVTLPNEKKKQVVYTYEIDHIIPFCYGGTNTLDNIQFLCPPCHARKSGTEKSISRILAIRN